MNPNLRRPSVSLLFAHCSLFVTLLVGLSPSPTAAEPFLDPAIEAFWSRADLPVKSGAAQRSYLWGEEPFASPVETYQDAPNQRRKVQYFDKSRMEITRDWLRFKPGGITNGRLVAELISGEVQLGDSSFGRGFEPAQIPVAGDPNPGNPNGPTYADLGRRATLDGRSNRADSRVGLGVPDLLVKGGGTGTVSHLEGIATIAHFDENLGHNIPNVFWDFMGGSGPVFAIERHKRGELTDQPVVKPEGGFAGETKEETVFNWIETMGYPVTEPYWMTTRVAGQDRTVLMQAFERRVLTYNPENDPANRVEMGNVGRHYYAWRYDGLPVGATVTTALTKVGLQIGQPALRVRVDKAEAIGNRLEGGADGSDVRTASGTFMVVTVTAENLSGEEQKIGTDLEVRAVTPEGIKASGPADKATASLNLRRFPPPAKCPCPPPLHMWTTIPPGKSMTIALVYDIPASSGAVRFTPKVEDTPAVVLR